MSECGIRKGLLVEEVPAEKMGVPRVPRMHLKEVQSSDCSCQRKGRREWEGQDITATEDIWVPSEV